MRNVTFDTDDRTLRATAIYSLRINEIFRIIGFYGIAVALSVNTTCTAFNRCNEMPCQCPIGRFFCFIVFLLSTVYDMSLCCPSGVIKNNN